MLQAVPEAHLVRDAAQVVVTVLSAVVVVTLLTMVVVTLLLVVVVTLLTVVDETLLTVVVMTQLIVVAGLGQALLEVAEVAVDCACTKGALLGC